VDTLNPGICGYLEGKMKDHAQYKRRNYFINKEFQGRYIFNYFLLAAIGSALFVAVFSFFSSNTLSIVYENYHLQLGLTPGILLRKILGTQWFVIVLGGGCVIVVTLFLTHRIAGPFYRFEKTLDEMIDGDLSNKVVLRKKDEGKELAQKINAFNYILSDKLSIMENFNAAVGISSRQLKKLLEESDVDEDQFAPYLQQIMDSQKNIQAMINDYTFDRDKL
jgi:methyl-accepting chemotaxis protein